MRAALAKLLQCPAGCAAPLALDAGGPPEVEVTSGRLTCGLCGARYAIEEGIARLLPPALAGAAESEGEGADARKRREMRARDDQAGAYDRMWHLSLFGLAEVPATMRFLSPDRGDTILEAGCGTGRMTATFAARCAHLVAADFSWESLRACAAKLRAAGARNVDLMQADVCRLPVRDCTFDRVVSCQVLEHIPTPESRAAAVADLARVLKPEGVLALSAYKYSLPMRLMGSRQGEHAGGIPFYRFERRELVDLLSTALRVEAATGALVYHYLTRSRKR